MKKFNICCLRYTLTTILFIPLFFSKLNAQCSYQTVGPDEKNVPGPNYTNYQSIAVDNNGVVYVSFQDASAANKITVRKFDSTFWTTVGTKGFSLGSALYTDIKIGEANTPYVIYSDAGNGNKATVKKWNGTNWVAVGMEGFSAGAATLTSMTMDASHTPYALFRDGENDNKLTVMKFNGTNWVFVGTPGFTSGYSEAPSFALNSAGEPYVAFSDGTNGMQPTVMKFDGTNWNVLGTAGFPTNWGNVTSTSFAIDTSGTPYLATNEMGFANLLYKFNGTDWVFENFISGSSTTNPEIKFTADNKLYIGQTFSNQELQLWKLVGGVFTQYSYGPINVTINNSRLAISPAGTPYLVYGYSDWYNGQDFFTGAIKLNGNNLEIVGKRGITDKPTENNVMAVDKWGTPYIAFRDVDFYPQKITVKKYNGSNWITAGAARFSAGGSDYISIATAPDGTAYVAYSDGSLGGKTCVKKFTGSAWVTVGTEGFSSGVAIYTKIKIDGNGTPYVAFTDGANGDKVSVMKFNGSNWVSVGTPGFSAGYANYVSLAIDNNAVPYVVYRDVADSNKATVMKYNGSNWVSVGSTGFTTGAAYETSIGIAEDGSPYISYESDNSHLISVMRYNGSNWVHVGAAGFDQGYFTSFNIAKGGLPYISYYEATTGEPTIKFFDGSTWVHAGSSNITPGTGEMPYMTTDNNGNPYVSYNNNVTTVFKKLGIGLASSNLNKTIAINAPFSGLFTDGCEMIARVKPADVNGISGNTTAKVWIEATQPATYVKRHYEITPASNEATAAGKEHYTLPRLNLIRTML